MQNFREHAENKEFLRTIAENEYEIPGDIDSFEFAKALLPNLGSTDQELRDELSYMTLARGLIGGQKLEKAQLEELLTWILGEEHLFYHIGEVGTDSVFMRSFSNLIIAAILYNDATHPALGEEIIQHIKNELLRYAREEKDWRGYVQGKGWAHAMAHLADTLDECAQNPGMGIEDRKEIMEAVSKLATIAEPLYHEEDARLANVAYRIILGKQVDEDFLDMWVKGCTVSREQDVTAWARATNARNFLRSLYFFLYWDNIASVTATNISTLLKKQEEIYIDKQLLD